MLDIMKNSWILLCGGYWLLFWVGRQWQTARTVLCLWDGFYIGLLSFAILPFAMETPYFYMAAVSSLLGVLLGFWMEKRGKTLLLLLCLTGVTAEYFLYDAPLSCGSALLFAFFGGMGLYTVAADLLPEDAAPEEHLLPSLLGAGGFLISTLFFAGL